MNIGIDLGTTFSLAGYVNSQGLPTLVPDSQQGSVHRTPSVVSVEGRQAWTGQVLEEMLLDEPGLPIARGFKQWMGTDTTVLRDNEGREWPPEALSALVLKKLLRDVEDHCAEAVDHCLITVPANFNDAQRRATRMAGMLAGLGSLSLVEEPIAAAAFYGFSERDAEQTLLVYDFGGGTFDATVLQISSGRLYVLATEGDNQLGGRKIDQALSEVVAADLKRRHGIDVMGDAAAAETVRRFAEAAKIALCQPGVGQLRKTLVLGPRVCEVSLGADQVERAVAPLVAASIDACRRCLDGSGLGWGQVDRILLVGGSSLLPQVTRALLQASGKPATALVSKQPHLAVAYGAALLAQRQTTPQAGVDDSSISALHHAVAPYSLGLRVRDQRGGERIEVLIKRNMPLPAQGAATFYTTRPEQTRLIFDVVQSKNEREAEASLGFFAFGPLRHPRKNYPVEVLLAYDVEGLVRVTARDLVTGEALHREMSNDDDPDQVRLLNARKLLGSLTALG